MLCAAYVQKHIIYKSSGKFHTAVDSSNPLISGAQIDDRVVIFDCTDDSETGKSCSNKWHSMTRCCKVADDQKPDNILARFQVFCHIESVIVPGIETAPGRTNCYTFVVDEQLVSCVCRKVNDSLR